VARGGRRRRGALPGARAARAPDGRVRVARHPLHGRRGRGAPGRGRPHRGVARPRGRRPGGSRPAPGHGAPVRAGAGARTSERRGARGGGRARAAAGRERARPCRGRGRRRALGGRCWRASATRSTCSTATGASRT
jgi:hypothetical protein